DLLGAVRMSIEAGLPDQQAELAAESPLGVRELLANRSRALGACGDRHRRTDARRGAELSENRSQRVRPFAGGRAGFRACDRWGHDVPPVFGRLPEMTEPRPDLPLAAARAEGAEPLDLRTLGGRIDSQD